MTGDLFVVPFPTTAFYALVVDLLKKAFRFSTLVLVLKYLAALVYEIVKHIAAVLICSKFFH